MITFFRKTFRDIFGQLHTQECKATEKQIVRLQLNLDPAHLFAVKGRPKRLLIL